MQRKNAPRSACRHLLCNFFPFVIAHLYKGEAMSTTMAAIGTPRAGRELDVLIAEDNADAAASLAGFLRAAGHRVRVALDGGSAVEAALHDPPDVVFLDIGLPGYDGWEVARAIRCALNGRPCLIVAVTGFDDDGDHQRSREAGINLHLRKPADPELLLSLLDRMGQPAS
jgi:CheY-like chemotaxis protein